MSLAFQLVELHAVSDPVRRQAAAVGEKFVVAVSRLRRQKLDKRRYVAVIEANQRRDVLR